MKCYNWQIKKKYWILLAPYFTKCAINFEVSLSLIRRQRRLITRKMHSQKHFILHLKLSIQNYKFSKNKSSSSFPFQLPSRYTSKIQNPKSKIKSLRQQIGKTEHYIYNKFFCFFSPLLEAYITDEHCLVC